jgi:hypothetical protein
VEEIDYSQYYVDLDSTPLKNLVEAIIKHAKKEFKEKYQTEIKDKLRGRYRNKIKATLFEGQNAVWKKLLDKRSDAKVQRKKILKEVGLAASEVKAEELIAEYHRKKTPLLSGPRRIESLKARKQLGDRLGLEYLKHLEEEAELRFVTKIEYSNPVEQIANRIVGDVLKKHKRSGQVSFIGKKKRKAVFGRCLSEKMLVPKKLINGVEEIIQVAKETILEGGFINSSDVKTFEDDLKKSLVTYLKNNKDFRFPTNKNNPNMTKDYDFSSFVLNQVKKSFSTGPNVTFEPKMKDCTYELKTFDSKKTGMSLAGSPTFGYRVPAYPEYPYPDGVKHLVKGFRIVSRPDSLFSGSDFFEEVPSPTTPFSVKLRNGSYTLIHPDSSGREVSIVLPENMIGSDIGPGKADEIRAGLMIEEIVEEVHLSQAEKEKRDEQLTVSTEELYTESVFYRPEYKIKTEGGRYGPLSIADLLRDPNSGVYIVPTGTVLLAGVKLKLLEDINIGMAGMISPEGVFITGNESINLESGDITLELEGDFHLIGGELISEAAMPEEFTNNSVSFNGRAKLRWDTEKIFESQASGHFKKTDEDWSSFSGSLNMTAHINHHWKWGIDVDIGDLDVNIPLAEAWVSADFLIEIIVNNSSLSFLATDTIKVYYIIPEIEFIYKDTGWDLQLGDVVDVDLKLPIGVKISIPEEPNHVTTGLTISMNMEDDHSDRNRVKVNIDLPDDFPVPDIEFTLPIA